MTPAIFALLESKIYGVSAPNQGAFEGFTLRGDLLCVPPASNDAESSSNQVLFCSVPTDLPKRSKSPRFGLNINVYLPWKDFSRQ